jgi:hypothetical protein
VTECSAIVDILEARGLLGGSEARHARGLLLRLSQMLSRLIARWQARDA